MVAPYMGDVYDRINEKDTRVRSRVLTLHKLRNHVDLPRAARDNQVCPYWWQGRGCQHITRCPALHPGFEDGFPLWKENLCTDFQISPCLRHKCNRLHMTWSEYLKVDKEAAWTDWMHIAAEKRGRQGPLQGNQPDTFPEWF